MAKFRGSDVLIVLRGLNAVSKAAANISEAQLKEAWKSSSIGPIVNNIINVKKREEIQSQFQEVTGRTLAVARGLKEFSIIVSERVLKTHPSVGSETSGFENLEQEKPYPVRSNNLINAERAIEIDNFKEGLNPTKSASVPSNSEVTSGMYEIPNEGVIHSHEVVNSSIKNESSILFNDAPSVIKATCSPAESLVNIPSIRPPSCSTEDPVEESLRIKGINSEANDSIIGCQEISPVSVVESKNVHLSNENGYSNAQKQIVSSNEINQDAVSELKDQTEDLTATVGIEPLKVASTSISPIEETQPSSVSSEIELANQRASEFKPIASRAKETEAERPDSTGAHVQPPIVVRKKLPKLSETARENTVPSSRIGRLASYGSLAAGLGFGALAEVTRRSLGLGKKNQDQIQAALDTSSPFLTEANAERIVNTLCKVRGAALKLGQMLSIQDSSLIHPQLLKIFERVRKSADFMPVRQMEKVLVDELGPDWRDRLKQFDEKPFAAASVGQVHYGVLHDGREVAMKIQYPGVAKGIESDINNLVGIMKVWNILPEGMYINEFIEVAKRELSWEVDYIRELEATKRFGSLLRNNPDYKVPEVIDELSSKQVFTTEFVEGISMEQCMEQDQDTRNEVAAKILKLCLSELFDFQYMQTDPNWANFLFNTNTRQLVLLDFGASREYGTKFVDNYIQVLQGAAEGNRQKVLEYSRALGFLTGYESQSMEEAHIDAVMILGEAFRCNGPFDFGQQNTTRRIQKLIPVMLNQRLRAPPEESYSLHRKMSGAFLLSAKLGAKINCKTFFDDVVTRYHTRQHVSS